jgi:hypothetical protein
MKREREKVSLAKFIRISFTRCTVLLLLLLLTKQIHLFEILRLGRELYHPRRSIEGRIGTPESVGNSISRGNILCHGFAHVINGRLLLPLRREQVDVKDQTNCRNRILSEFVASITDHFAIGVFQLIDDVAIVISLAVAISIIGVCAIISRRHGRWLRCCCVVCRVSCMCVH